jgi:hypothetical protein
MTRESAASKRNRLQGVDRRPSTGEIEEAARNIIQEGVDPTPGGRETEDCPECGTPVVVGRAEVGPDVDSLREVITFARNVSRGYLSEAEFDDLVREEFETVLQDLREEDDDGLNAEVYASLDSFEDDGGDA